MLRMTTGRQNLLSPVLLLALALTSSVAAQSTGRPDSAVTRYVRPGLVQTTKYLSGPTVVNMLTVDLHQSRIGLESFRPESLTRTSQQVRLRTAEGVIVLGAVNADFFSFTTQWPLGHQFTSGEIIHASASYRRSHIGWGPKGIFMDTLRFSGIVRRTHAPDIALGGVNQKLDSAGVTMYTARWGIRTRTDSGTVEWVVKPLGTLRPGSSVRARISAIHHNGNSTITPGSIVLAFSQYRPIPRARSGERVVLDLGFTQDVRGITDLVGGSGRILYNGEDLSDSLSRAEGLGRKFLTDRHPRTFVGIDRDTTRLFLAVVDGRQATSIGMNFGEMAAFLKQEGVWNAINLDGGGSTTMVVESSIVNAPSDKVGERPVANAILVVEKKQK